MGKFIPFLFSPMDPINSSTGIFNPPPPFYIILRPPPFFFIKSFADTLV